MEYIDGVCSICDRNTNVRHIALYAFGSEGIWTCEMCSRMLCDVVRTLASTIKRRIYWARAKEGAESE